LNADKIHQKSQKYNKSKHFKTIVVYRTLASEFKFWKYYISSWPTDVFFLQQMKHNRYPQNRYSLALLHARFTKMAKSKQIQAVQNPRSLL